MPPRRVDRAERGAAISEGLPVAIPVALAIATNPTARRKVIVRALPAVAGTAPAL